MIEQKLLVPGLSIDYRCDSEQFLLSAHDCQVPTPNSQNLEVDGKIRSLEQVLRFGLKVLF
jgi:hypothetical protein